MDALHFNGNMNKQEISDNALRRKTKNKQVKLVDGR